MTPLGAFVRRDLHVALSYRLPFVLDILAAAFTVIPFALVSQIVAPGEVPGGYLTFVMVGLVLGAFLQAGVTVVAGNLRQEQVQGTLEAVLSYGRPVWLLSAGMTAYPLLSAVWRAIAYGVVAIAVGARAPGANWPLGLLALVLGSISFAGIGLIGAALVIVIRQAAAATTWLVATLTLAAGVLFPLRLFPDWARTLANLSPVTQTLRVGRDAILSGAGWSSQAGRLAILGSMAVGFTALGIAVLTASLSWARRSGALSQY